MPTVRSLLALLLAATALLPGCGGGGGGGGAGGGVIQPSVCAGFTGQDTPRPGFVTAARDPASDCGLLLVNLSGTEIFDVYGARVLLRYDPQTVEYAGFSAEGTFLAKDGASVEALGGLVAPGDVEIGLTRTGTILNVSASPTERLVQVRFRPLRIGNSSLEPGGSAFYDNNEPPQPRYTSWTGGTVSVR